MIRPVRCVATAAASLAISIALFAVASPALAVEHHPKGEFAVFSDCPLSNPNTSACLVAKTEAGEFTINKETVPIVNAITLQGGARPKESPKEEGEAEFIGAEDGNTLSETPQQVPGGLAGLVKCNEISNLIERLACELVFQNGITGVTETSELAAPASSIGLNVENEVLGRGTALSLPTKVHLENPFLGSSCYIGSTAHPIVIEFTSGTTSPPPPNKPISGSPGELVLTELITAKNNVLVNNSFAAPGAEGCGGVFSFLIDPIINSKLGLPSAAGNNTAILKGTLKIAEAETVKAHE
jgi:hypothetical protein